MLAGNCDRYTDDSTSGIINVRGIDRRMVLIARDLDHEELSGCFRALEMEPGPADQRGDLDG